MTFLKEDTMKKFNPSCAMYFLLPVLVFLCTLNTARAEQTTKEVTFAGLSALSGGASPWGVPIQRALILGFDKLNEEGGFNVKGQHYKWKLVTYDHKYVPAEAVKAIHRAIYNDGAKFALIQGGPQPMACMPVLHENKVLSLNPAAASIIKKEYPLSFNYNPSILTAYAAILPYLKKREGIKTMASIYHDTPGSKAAHEELKMVAGINNLNVVASSCVEPVAKEFSPVLTKIIAAKPDMIETCYLDPTQCALVTKQARELGYKGVIWLTWGPDVDQVLKIVGSAAEGTYMGLGGPLEPRTAIEKGLYKRFVEKYPAKDWAGNSSSLYNPYWLPMVLTEAIEKCQSFDAATVAATLEDMSWEGPQGKHAFGGKKLYGLKRQLLRPVTLVQIQGGKAVWIADEPVPPGILD